MPRIGLAGVRLQNLAIELFRFAQATAPVMVYRLIQ
jgi:hypothetical protein